MGSGPKAPDPYKQAEAQNNQNMMAAFINSIMGNANQYNPYGSVTSEISGYVPYTDPTTGRVTQIPRWSQTTSLSPAQQAIFDQENAAKLGFGKLANQQIGQLKDVLGKPFNTEGLQAWGTYGQGPELQYEKGPTDRAAIERAMMDSYTRGVTPQHQAENAQLAARGQSPGGGMDYRTQSLRSDALGEQTRQAYLASGGESRNAMEAVNKALQQGWLNANARTDQGNALRQSQFGERQQTRNQLVNEASALMGGGQATVPQGQAWQGGQVNPFDIAGAQNNAYNIQAQQHAGKMSGMFGLAGNVLGMMGGGPLGSAAGGALGSRLGGGK